MQTITLTTDWGTDGIYVGALKGKILTDLPTANVIDISHQITPFDIGQAAFTIRSCYRLFPEGSIHIIGVGGEINRKAPANRKYVCFKKNNHYFIGNDDGYWKLLFDELPTDVFLLNYEDAYNEFAGFPELGIFSKAIVTISANKPLSNIGTPYENGMQFQYGIAAIHESMINGEIINFDSFGNAITNISKTDFERVRKNRDFEIFIGSYSNKHTISKINKEYCESVAGDLLAIFSYSGFLEIAIANARAADLLNFKQNKEVRVKFKNDVITPEPGRLF